MPGQNKSYCQDESGNYGKTIWQYRWPLPINMFPIQKGGSSRKNRTRTEYFLKRAESKNKLYQLILFISETPLKNDQTFHGKS